MEFVPCIEIEGEVIQEFNTIQELLGLPDNKITCLSSIHNDDVEECFYNILDNADVVKRNQEPQDEFQHYLVNYGGVNLVLTSLNEFEFYIFLAKKDVNEFETFV